MPYDDSTTGKHFDFEWQARIDNRNRNNGNDCPFLSNPAKAIWVGFNDLATVNPELAKEWHPTKNGNLKPEDVTPNSGLKAWWYLPYDDPVTGKHFDFEWQARISHRYNGIGCPFLSGRQVWQGFNDLATTNPKLAKEWHPSKNGNLKPTDVTAGTNKKVWWLLPYDTEDGKHFDFEWKASIALRNRGENCPFLAKANARVCIGFNDLVTINPELAKQWHPTKNGKLKPTEVTASSIKEVWWLLPYDDSITGKHFNFEWQATIGSRNNGSGCPYLGKNQYSLLIGFNDLATINPELAKEWHPVKNGDLKPTDVVANSGLKVWWLLPYDDPVTGKHFDFEWQATIAHRNNGVGCPFLTNPTKAVWVGFNDLATANPELANQWHSTKNGDLKPIDVTASSNQKVWWFLPYDDPVTGKHFDFEWEAQIKSRNEGNGCPYLSGKAVWIGFNDLATTNFDLTKQWHPTKNGTLKPEDVTSGSHKQIWWLYSYDDPVTGKHFNFEWEAQIKSRNSGIDCPFLSGQAVWQGFNDLATTNPELAKEWHPSKNGNLKPTDVTAYSQKKVWWLLHYYDVNTNKYFDFEWQAYINNRSKGIGCPFLTSSKTEYFIYNLMKENKINFKPEKNFLDCKDKNLLPFDIYISSKKIIIECDGIQHFKPIEYFGGKEALKINKKHDRIKNEFCKNNNIPILRIPYIYDPIVDKEKIEEFVLNFIKTKQVPQEILDYYNQFEFSNYTECVTELNEKIIN